MNYNSKKYLKYKNKYLELKNIQFGGNNDNILVSNEIKYKYKDGNKIYFNYDSKDIDENKQLLSEDKKTFKKQFKFTYDDKINDDNLINYNDKKNNDFLKFTNDEDIIKSILINFLSYKKKVDIQKQEYYIQYTKDNNIIHYKQVDKTQIKGFPTFSKTGTYTLHFYETSELTDFKELDFQKLTPEKTKIIKRDDFEFGFNNEIKVNTIDDEILSVLNQKFNSN